MQKRDIKIFVIHKKFLIDRTIDILYENPLYHNHLEYWQEHLSKVKYETVSSADLYHGTRNLIAIKIAMEGNIVFMDTSKKRECYRSGVVFLPSNISSSRKKLAFMLTSSYDYLNVIYDIYYDGKSYRAKEKDIVLSSNSSKVVTYHL